MNRQRENSSDPRRNENAKRKKNLYPRNFFFTVILFTKVGGGRGITHAGLAIFAGQGARKKLHSPAVPPFVTRDACGESKVKQITGSFGRIFSRGIYVGEKVSDELCLTCAVKNRSIESYRLS